MKTLLPTAARLGFLGALVAGFLPGAGGAQGYPGLMAPQSGYTAPRAQAHQSAAPHNNGGGADDAQNDGQDGYDASGSAGETDSGSGGGGGLGAGALPFGGTGADTHVGHATVTGSGAGANTGAGGSSGESDDAGAGAEGGDGDTPAQNANNAPGSMPLTGYAATLAPKPKEFEDTSQPSNLYDYVKTNSATSKADAPARALQARANAALQKQRSEIDQMNAETTQRDEEQTRAYAQQVQDSFDKQKEDAESGAGSYDSSQ
jgi:hypothetical protein